MINDPEMIKELLGKMEKVSKEDIEEAIKKVELEDIENMKMYFQERIDKDFIEDEDLALNFMKIALNYITKLERHMSFYEKNGSYKARIIELKEENEQLKEKADSYYELYWEKCIPIPVILDRLNELDEQIKEFTIYVNESLGEEKQYWKRERAELVGARGALLGLLRRKE